MKPWMSDRDICDMYNRAVDQQEQIKILAQLNDCDRSEITRILERNGIVPVKPHTVKHRAEPYKPWTVADLIQLLYLINNGADDNLLAGYFDRSITAIRNIKYKMNSDLVANPSKNIRKALEIFHREYAEVV